MKTAIYVRVSTEEQAKEGYSISGQLQKLKAFCISQNWTVEEIYVDEGISAKDMNRPQLKKMLKDIKRGKIECVLIYKLDRLTRSVSDLYKILETFEKHDCKFKSATEIYDTTTAMGRMFITIVAALAQWERENMGERIAFGFAEKLRQGKFPLNFAPLGYDLNKSESKLYINPKEAIIVKTIFNKYLEGFGSNRLIRYMNENKLLTKRGNEWSSDTLFKVLRSPIPAGGIRWNGELHWDLHEPIISKDDWELVQHLRKERRIKHPRSVSSNHLFSRLIPCPKCGQNLVGSNSNYYGKNGKTVYYYYNCNNVRENKCNYRYSIAQKRVEEQFLYYITKINFNDFIQNISAADFIKDKNEFVDIDALERELEVISNRKKKWQYAWSDGIMTNEDFKERMKEANKDEEIITEQLEKFTTIEDDEFDVNEIKEMLNNIRDNWDNLKTLEKKSILSSIIKSIHVERVGSEVIINKIDFL